ncbi:MAG: ATP-binding protein [Bacteroidales bacterium]
MQIRTRLTLQFLLIGGLIMIIASCAIFFSSAGFRKDDFQNRLKSKARNTARLLFDAESIEPQRVLNLEKDNPSNLQDEKIIIINFLDNVVYSSDEKSEIKIRWDIVEKVRNGYTLNYRQGPYEIVATLYLAKLDRFVVIAAATDIEGNKHLKKLKAILLIVCLLSLVVFFIAGWFYSGRALKPISDVVKRVDEISITSLNLRLPEGNGTDELGRLARTFNGMLSRLETSFAMQKDFIANASHELRTPLTSVNGQLEVLMLKERSSEEYRIALESVLDDIKKLIELSNRLLLIARTSAEGPAGFEKKVRVDEVLWQAQEDTKRYRKDYNISISMSPRLTEAEQMTVTGDENLLRVVVSNLIDNACKYSPDHSVEIKMVDRPGEIELQFEDHGIGIPREELQKVFEPFYRGSNTHSANGTGIGLPLVKQIVSNHNGRIDLSSVVGKGTKVSVILPLAR